jgi:POT family proton-dependent oligopeptide transporter
MPVIGGQARLPSDTAPVRLMIGGHPRGLVLLFFVEMWERFSYYGMRSLLILYLTQHFLFSDSRAQGLYASYASLVYLMPLVGGFVADRYLGARKAVLIGALFLTAGHFVMAFEGAGGRQFIVSQDQRWDIVAQGQGSERKLLADDGRQRLALRFDARRAQIGSPDQPGYRAMDNGHYRIDTQSDPVGEGILFLALSLIIVGVGFLKSNISTLLGTLYAAGDPNRDSGFTIFYVGINIGSVLATSLCGWLGLAYGWRWGFGLAGVGMMFGFVTFLLGKGLLSGHGEPPEDAGPVWHGRVWIGAMLALGPIWWLVQHDEVTSRLLILVASTALVVMLAWSLFACRGDMRRRMVVAIVLILFAIVFRTLLDQAGSTITLYASRLSDLRLIGDVRMTAAQTTLFNPLLIVTIAPLFAGLWSWLGKRGRDPGVPVKFACGLALAGLGYLMLAYGASHFARDVSIAGRETILVPLVWLFLCYLLHTLGEICVAPVGLSMITRLSAPRVVGLMMGMWYLASSLAYAVAGQIGKLTSTVTTAGIVLDPHLQLRAYVTVFGRIGWVGLGAAALLFALSPLLRRVLAGGK